MQPNQTWTLEVMRKPLTAKDPTRPGPDAAAAQPAKAPDEPGKGSTKRLWIGLALVAVTALALGLWWLLSRPAKVDVFIVKTSTVERVLAVVGRARPTDLIDVRSPNPGQVIALLHDDGDSVIAGEPLAIIKATVEQAQTEVGAAQIRAAVAERNRARLAFNRTKILAEKGFTARAGLDEARATLQAAQANLDAATATTVAAAERTRQFTVRAPLTGVVLFRAIDNGQVILPTTSLFQLGSAKGSEIQAQVDEAYADVLRPGLTARVVLTGSDRVFPARVTEVSPQVDSATGGRLIKLIPSGGPALAPGRSLDITIVVDRRTGGIVIPRAAVMDPSTRPKVYVVDQQNMVRPRNISVLRWPSLDAIIEDGLSPGDRIVLTPAVTKANVRVKPMVAAAKTGG